MELSLSMWILAILCAFMIGMAKTGIHALGTLVVPIMAFIFGGMPSSGTGFTDAGDGRCIWRDCITIEVPNGKRCLKVLPWAFAGNPCRIDNRQKHFSHPV